MALDLLLGLAALRLAVGLARFTKSRVCTSCFGSTNSGMRLFTKSQICISCFGSTNPGRLASFNFRMALLVVFPPHPIVSFVPCFSSAVQVDSRTMLDHTHSMRLANGSNLTALASVSLSRPPFSEFVAAANLLFEFVFVNCKLWPVHATFLVTFVLLTEGRSAWDLTQAASSQKKPHHERSLNKTWT